MHVHLVAVKVGVVRRRNGQVHAKCAVREDPHAMSHDGHLVQTRLPIEEHDVSVHHVPLNHHAILQVPVARLLEVSQVDAVALGVDDVLGTSLARQRIRAILHELLEPLVVVRRDDLRDGEVERDCARHAELVQREIRVGRDDRTRGEVNALSHQVAAYAALLRL